MNSLVFFLDSYPQSCGNHYNQSIPLIFPRHDPASGRWRRERPHRRRGGRGQRGGRRRRPRPLLQAGRPPPGELRCRGGHGGGRADHLRRSRSRW